MIPDNHSMTPSMSSSPEEEEEEELTKINITTTAHLSTKTNTTVVDSGDKKTINNTTAISNVPEKDDDDDDDDDMALLNADDLSSIVWFGDHDVECKEEQFHHENDAMMKVVMVDLLNGRGSHSSMLVNELLSHLGGTSGNDNNKNLDTTTTTTTIPLELDKQDNDVNGNKESQQKGAKVDPNTFIVPDSSAAVENEGLNLNTFKAAVPQHPPTAPGPEDERHDEKSNIIMASFSSTLATATVAGGTAAAYQNFMSDPPRQSLLILAPARGSTLSREVTPTNTEDDNKILVGGATNSEPSSPARQRNTKRASVAGNGSGCTTDEAAAAPAITGRPPIQLYLSADYDSFSTFQVAVRKNVEFFEASADDIATSAQGRPRPIVMGQVGIRCCFCARLHPSKCPPGAVCYPSKRCGIYQATQNIAKIHWMEQCPQISPEFHEELMRRRALKCPVRRRASKVKWARRATALGVFEDVRGLRFAPTVDAFGFPRDDDDDVDTSPANTSQSIFQSKKVDTSPGDDGMVVVEEDHDDEVYHNL
ncbi:hypothetical protein ACA910_005182 [Epithemia clementina (nom. ined.)]